ncbi:MAG: BON domain-containing protein [Pseudomonadota bacterium]
MTSTHLPLAAFSHRRSLASALALALITVLTGCAAPGETEARTTGRNLDDRGIRRVVTREIRRADPALKKAHLDVTSYNGIVLLLGQVDTEKLKAQATKAALGVRRVRKVHNEIQVSGPISRVSRSNDAWLSSKVKTRLIANKNIRGSRVKVVTENGVVYLMGLMTRDHADKVVATAQQVFGVQKIVKVFEYIEGNEAAAVEEPTADA